MRVHLWNSPTHHIAFQLRFSLSAAHSLNDLQGQRNKLLVLDLAICIHVCLPPTALGKVQFRIGSSCYKPTKCMDMHEPGKIIDSSSQFPILYKCPEDSTNLKPLADNQFHWFHVDYKYIEHIISTYSYIPSYHAYPANSRLFLSKFDLKFLPWKTPLAPRPGRAGSRPSGSRDAAASLASRLWTRLDPRTGWNPAEQFWKDLDLKKVLLSECPNLGRLSDLFFPTDLPKESTSQFCENPWNFRVLIIFLEEVQYDGLNLIQRPQLLFASRCENHNCVLGYQTCLAPP